MIYLDNAATTKTAPEVVEAMLPYFSEYYGNPSSIYAIAGKSKEAITKGREQIANVLGAKPEEIYFTAGGSESDNWALKLPLKHIKIKETTSSPQKSSIMRFFIPVSIWKKSAVRKSPISASMRTALSIWMNSKQPSHLRPF